MPIGRDGIVEVDGAAGLPPGGLLFDRVSRFGFIGPARGRMRVTALPIGPIPLGMVRSTGHDLAVEEPGRSTFLVPLDGRVAVEAGGRRLEAGPGGGLFLPRGHRLTQVRPAEAGFRAGAGSPGAQGRGDHARALRRSADAR